MRVNFCDFDKEEGGSSDADVRTYWCKKLRIFRNLWCVRTDKKGGGLNQCGYFPEKRRINFCDFEWTYFMDGPYSIL